IDFPCMSCLLSSLRSPERDDLFAPDAAKVAPSSNRLMKVTLHVVRNVHGLGSGLSANAEKSQRYSGEGRGLCGGARYRARSDAQLATCPRYVSTRAADTDCRCFAKGTTARLAGAEVPKY